MGYIFLILIKIINELVCLDKNSVELKKAEFK